MLKKTHWIGIVENNGLLDEHGFFSLDLTGEWFKADYLTSLCLSSLDCQIVITVSSTFMYLMNFCQAPTVQSLVLTTGNMGQ